MVPPYDRRARQEIEDELCFRVEQAVAYLQFARTERDRLSAISADVADTPDGAVAAWQSVRLHREAMQRLRHALNAAQEFKEVGGS